MSRKHLSIMAAGIVLTSQMAVAAPAPAEVRFVYLVPSDRPISTTYPDRIAFAARHVQSWLASRLDGRTFRLASPAVRVVRSDKPARWFGTTDRHSGFSAFYRNALDENGRVGAGKPNDPQARYIVYVDADHSCGQSGAGGNGVAVVSANDLRGLSGDAIVPACDKANGAEIAGRCRWIGGMGIGGMGIGGMGIGGMGIGGMGHELLHTLGLKHPDTSPACQTSQCRSTALMIHGYVRYPDAGLLDDDIATLKRSPFVSAQPVNRLVDCRGP